MDEKESQQNFDLPGTPAEPDPSGGRKPRQLMLLLVVAAMIAILAITIAVTALPAGPRP